MSTIASLTARSLLGRSRVLLLIPLPALVVTLAMLASAAGVKPQEWSGLVIVGLGCAVVLPVIALIVGTSVLGSEIEDGTIVHILTKPLPRWQIVLPKLAVAAGVTAVTVAVPLGVAGVLAHSPRFALGLMVAGAVGALAYSALFLALSLVTRRPVLLGLVYVLLWEGLLGGFVRGTRVLSVQQYVVAIADRLVPTSLLTGSVSVSVSVVMSVLIIVGGSALAIHRLTGFSMAGETS